MCAGVNPVVFAFALALLACLRCSCITNAPATFMWFINNIFPHLGKLVVIYLDDIMVFNSSWEEHMQHVRTVLTLL